jgi:hypothetical protein
LSGSEVEQKLLEKHEAGERVLSGWIAIYVNTGKL